MVFLLIDFLKFSCLPQVLLGQKESNDKIEVYLLLFFHSQEYWSSKRTWDGESSTYLKIYQVELSPFDGDFRHCSRSQILKILCNEVIRLPAYFMELSIYFIGL